MQRPPYQKADQLTVRRLNMSAILKLLRERGTMARADLAKELGMTRNTASNIVNDLLQAGLLVETEFRRVGAGRPGLLLELSPKGGFAIGAEIDIHRVTVIAVDFRGETQWSETLKISREQGEAAILFETEQLVERALDWGRDQSLTPLGIGLGLAGLVDAENGVLTYAPTLGWREIPFKARWEERFGVPTRVDNGANTSALGYYAYADRSHARNLVYLSVGAGMAAGLILEGELFHGSGGFAGQAGHMKIRVNGEPCACGDRGCWVTEVGFDALARKLDRSEVDLPKLTSALENGDETLFSRIESLAEMLGLGIANLVNLFNLDTVVLGGAMSPVFSHLLEKTREVVDDRALKEPRANTRILVSSRDDDAVFGAACLALDTVMNDPVSLVRALP